jgi:hypothetical protein
MAATKAATANQRLERKLDANSREIKNLNKRLDTINLNGSAPALRSLGSAAPGLVKLATAAPALLALAEAAPSLIAEVEAKREEDAFKRGLHKRAERVKQYLHPFKPVGALIWIAVTALVSAVIWGRVAPLVHLHP